MDSSNSSLEDLSQKLTLVELKLLSFRRLRVITPLESMKPKCAGVMCTSNSLLTVSSTVLVLPLE